MNLQIFSDMVKGAATRFLLMGCALPEQGLLAGPERLSHLHPWPEPDETWMGEDNRHFPMNIGLLIKEGIDGLLVRARHGRTKACTEEQRARLDAITSYLSLFAGHIQAHAALARSYADETPDSARRYLRIAANCSAIAGKAPQTFEEGIQLFWFAWRARSLNFTSCIGRFDVQLGWLYQKSRDEGITREEAHDLLCELIRKLNRMGSGDTLMNLMLGGVDEEGRDVSSDFGVLVMECCAEVGLSEPHVNIRIHPQTPSFFRSAAARLMARGQGQGTLYFDAEIIGPLEQAGVPLPFARGYANDGCTEITLEGHADIQFWQMESMKALELALFDGEENPSAPHTPVTKWNRHFPARRFESGLRFGVRSGSMETCRTFDEVIACFYRQWDAQLTLFCQRITEKILDDTTTDSFQTSLLVQAMLPRVLESGNEPLRGGYECSNYQLLSGSIPTVADSLYAIKVAVFDRQICSLPQLLAALRSDFAGQEVLRGQLLRIDKFGNDQEEVDLLAAALAEHFCQFVEQYPFPCGVKVLPGLYNIDFVMFASILGATPDGRNAGDAISCHYSPTPSCARQGITAALSSSAKGNLRRGVAASPVYLTLPRLLDTDYAAVFLSLLEGCEQLHLPVINLSVVDADELRDAQKRPERHRDLVVRVWGYNANFVDLDDALQEHIINRTVHQTE